MKKQSVLIIAPHLDEADVGESYTALKLLQKMSPHINITTLTFECRYGRPLREQLPLAEVITFEEPFWSKPGRLASLFKPQVMALNAKVERWIREALSMGRHFDIAHQILPRAPRHASALRKFNIPYVIGSLGGALPTPPEFLEEVETRSLSAYFRRLDDFRFRYDPVLRASYGNAELVLGVAPYMKKILSNAPMRRFDSMLGIGIEDLPAITLKQAKSGPLRLLHVGRGVRTKGLRDVVRALPHIRDLSDVTLTSIGAGDEIDRCRREAIELGVSESVQFLGRLPRQEIENYYRDSDIFVFPSFRESMGGVLYEAMRWGLPVITVDYGGPSFITDDNCAIRLPVSSPQKLAQDVATAIRDLHANPEKRIAMGLAARERVKQEGLWEKKAARLINLYEQTLGSGFITNR